MTSDTEEEATPPVYNFSIYYLLCLLFLLVVISSQRIPLAHGQKVAGFKMS
jgi:hypothetical protein